MKSTQTANSPTDRLRSATWHRHQRIEKCGILKRVFSADYQLEEYAVLLHRVYGFYRVVEPLLAYRLAGDSESAFRRPPKASLLVMDLQGLGCTAPGLEESPECGRVPSIETAEEAIGVSYVLEGATMGGCVISKHLAGHFGGVVEKSLGFYRSYGDATVPNWLAFKEALNQRFADDEAGMAAIIRAADATYLGLTEYLEQTRLSIDEISNAEIQM